MGLHSLLQDSFTFAWYRVFLKQLVVIHLNRKFLAIMGLETPLP
jgi:hypothetical protein